MAFFHRRPEWHLPESSATPESVYMNRRSILRAMGLGGLALSGGVLLQGCSQPTDSNNTEPGTNTSDGGSQTDASSSPTPEGSSVTPPSDPLTNYDKDAPGLDLYPPKRNTNYKVPERDLTPEKPVQTYNNFYEFSTSKGGVWPETGAYDTTPWTLEVTGLVDNPIKIDLDKLMRQMSLEERVYRFRCVEAWAMTVPWTGFPLAQLLKLASPQSKAKYIRLHSTSRPAQMPGIDRASWYPWPYQEGLRLDEAMNELAMVVTGVFGKPLTKQMGAPVRVILPWKYGYKGPKAVEKIEVIGEQPKTFWNTAIPEEYGFYSNVNPNKPHPRWSQAEERLLPDGTKTKTLLYNGYADQVGSLYTGDEF